MKLSNVSLTAKNNYFTAGQQCRNIRDQVNTQVVVSVESQHTKFESPSSTQNSWPKESAAKHLPFQSLRAETDRESDDPSSYFFFPYNIALLVLHNSKIAHRVGTELDNGQLVRTPRLWADSSRMGCQPQHRVHAAACIQTDQHHLHHWYALSTSHRHNVDRNRHSNTFYSQDQRQIALRRSTCSDEQDVMSYA